MPISFSGTELSVVEWLAYGIGGVALMAECHAYRLQDGQQFRRWTGGSALLWSLMYLGLDAITAALTMGTTALRTVLSGRIERGGHKRLVSGLFLLLFAGLTLSAWQGAVSLLPAFAVMNTTWALFHLGNRAMRLSLLASSAVWIWNDVLWDAWPALLAESMAAMINVRTLIRLHRAGDEQGEMPAINAPLRNIE
jgi:hypothetical protein